MALDLSRILGLGADQPVVDLEDEIGAAARTPASISAAPPSTSSPSLPSRSFAADTILGLAPDDGRNFRRSLAGGLSAAAANYDKPAMTAATAGFGGALGAGKGEETGFQRKIDMLDRAIRAHRIGDMDEVRRALAELLQAQRESQTAPYPTVEPSVGAMVPPSTPASTFYDNVLGLPLIGTGDTQPVSNDRAPGRPQASGFAAAATPTAGVEPDHDAILDQALRAAYVPPEHLEPHHLVGAATLMAKQGLTPADAYEGFVMQSMRDIGLIDSAEWQDLYGLGTAGDVQPASAPQGETPEQRDLKDWPPRQAPTNQGREAGPFDSAAFAPAAPLAIPSRDLAWRGSSADTKNESPEQRDLKDWPPNQAPTNEGRETGPSDSGSFVAQSEDLPLPAVQHTPTTEHSGARFPKVLAAMDESERRRLLGQKPELIGGGGGTGHYGGSTAGGRSPLRRPTSAFHYTFERRISDIEREGLKAGTYATPTGTLSPMQAHIDLALSPNQGLRDVRIRIDLAGLLRAGYRIPAITRVGRHYGMPGGGHEMRFPYRIKPEFLTVIRP